MRCKCGCMMIWNSDYVSGIFVSWYTCPMCGHDTRDYHNYGQTTWSDHIVPLAESEDKCKNCEYYCNPDYTRCHECEVERSE